MIHGTDTENSNSQVALTNLKISFKKSYYFTSPIIIHFYTSIRSNCLNQNILQDLLNEEAAALLVLKSQKL